MDRIRQSDTVRGGNEGKRGKMRNKGQCDEKVLVKKRVERVLMDRAITGERKRKEESRSGNRLKEESRGEKRK
jgi:hypothetical protein